MEMAKTFRGEFSRRGFIDSVLPELLGILGADRGGLVSQRAGQWTREIWVGDSARIPEVVIGDAVDCAETLIADGWCVSPLEIPQSL